MKDFIIPWDDRDMGTPAKEGAPVTLSVDGFDVTVPEGTSVMRAAAEAGLGARDETQAQLAAMEAAITQLLREHHAHIEGVSPGPPGAVRRPSRFLP